MELWKFKLCVQYNSFKLNFIEVFIYCQHKLHSDINKVEFIFWKCYFHMLTVVLYVQYLTTIVVEFILHESMTEFTFYKSKLNINNGSKDKRNIL